MMSPSRFSPAVSAAELSIPGPCQPLLLLESLHIYAPVVVVASSVVVPGGVAIRRYSNTPRPILLELTKSR